MNDDGTNERETPKRSMYALIMTFVVFMEQFHSQSH